MNIVKKSTSLGFVTGVILSLLTGNAAAAINISQSPLFLAEQVGSNVMVMLDNSGSMKNRMYTSTYNDGTDYNGIFKAGVNYTYNTLIPVNSGAYPDMVNAGSTVIDTNAKGAFVVSGCTPAAGTSNCWSGRFLNWLTTRRIDASREVLVGGKLESRTAYPTYGTNLNFKIVANNERSDGSIIAGLSSSDDLTPIPNYQALSVSSPAEKGDFKTNYDPYAKLNAHAVTPLYNSASNVIGEFGSIIVNTTYNTITLSKSYTDPIVITTAPSHNGGDPSVMRVTNVTNNSFDIKLQEWDYRDGAHSDETVSFLVIENGQHDLVDGMKIKAGKINTSDEYVDGNCGASRTSSTSVNFASAFAATPVVISSVMTENDGDAINSRVWDINNNGFNLALQEEETPTTPGHSSETVGYIAISTGTATDSTNDFIIKVGTKANVTKSQANVNFNAGFKTPPSFLAATQTKNNDDTFALRLNRNNFDRAGFHIEEEKSCDNEDTHPNETVGYIALEGDIPTYNLAVVVTDEPTGVLHNVKDDVRLGITFYRYDPSSTNNDIYNGSTINGGTLNFKIPKNPFVKKPWDTGTLPADQQGYRDLEGYIDTPFADIVDAVEHFPLIWGTTPIAENLWEIIQYFEQDDPHYDASAFTKATTAPADDTRDPFYFANYGKKLNCVNSNILVVTDGAPFKDANIPLGLVDYDEDSNAKDQNTAASNNQEDNLDDVAYWAFCDKTPGSCMTGGKATVKDAGVIRSNLRDLRTDTGMDGDQFLKIDTIGFAGSTIRQVLKDTADNAGGKAFAANDGASLREALTEAFETASSNTSASSVAANSTRLDSNTLIYQASLDSGNWSGKLQAFGLNATTGAVNALPDWHTDTFDKIKDTHSQRNIFTFKTANAKLVPTGGTPNPTADPSGAGLDFTTLANFNADQQADLNNSQALIDYLRGDATNEGEGNGLEFRARSLVTVDPLTDLPLPTGSTYRRLLGDIANSNPWFVGGDNFGYSTLPGDSGLEGSSYTAHLAVTGSRTNVIYVGANDGMLHAFDAGTGVEKFAYVPSTIIPDIAQLADTNYAANHKYLVDGSPRAGDVYFPGSGGTPGTWHTVLVGTTGAGGRGVFALDVTDPDNFDASDVLWEFNSDYNDGDMGRTLSEPTIVRMANGDWAAIVGNGYNSKNHSAVLYILDIKTGAVIRKIDTEKGDSTTPNGLSSHVPVDINGDRIVDFIYAGDILGNLWKFDVSHTSNTNNWKSAHLSGSTPEPMFVATDASSNRQPITAKPQVGRHPDGGVMVYFGTGQYFEVGDNTVGVSPPLQTYYGLHDDLSNAISGRSVLQEQTIDAEAAFLSFDVRVTSDNTVNYNDSSDPTNNPLKKGWYMDLESPINGAEGERVIAASILRGDRIVFTTLIPDKEPCEFGGDSWLMELDGVTGARLNEIAFDLTNDGLFTTDDLVQLLDTDGDGDVDADDDKLIVSGKKSKVGIIKTPSVISTGDKEFKYSSGTTGGIDVTTESSGEGLGRQSWRQLR